MVVGVAAFSGSEGGEARPDDDGLGAEDSRVGYGDSWSKWRRSRCDADLEACIIGALTGPA